MDQIRMLQTPSVPEVAYRAAFFGIDELVRELTGYPPDVRDYGISQELVDHYWVPERQQLDVARPISYWEAESGKYGIDAHIDIVVADLNLCDVTNPDMSFCVGAASGRTAFVSVFHFLPFLERGEEGLFFELVKQETAHELGHILRLADRHANVYEALGMHCANPECVMHQGMEVPRDWEVMVQHRLGRGGRYACPDCHADALRNGML